MAFISQALCCFANLNLKQHNRIFAIILFDQAIVSGKAPAP